MVKLLHIETSTKVCSVALSENGRLTVLKETEEDGFTHAENLTVFIQNALAEVQWKLNDLDAICVTSGPGSYTGLRIGVSTAKGLCYSLDKPLISIDALSSIAFQAKKVHPNKTICALIDARRMEVFSLIKNSSFETVKEISADIIEEDTYAEFSDMIICGDGAEKLQEIWTNRNFTFETNIKSSAKGQVELAFNKFNNSDFEDVAYFEPFYLKDFVGTKSKKLI